jgi:hypothetical protein
MLSALLPVGGRIGVYAEAGAQGTEEGVLRGVDHDADMSGPGDQVAGLGVHDEVKFRNAPVEIGRADVGVRKAGTFINGVHEMRAIGLGVGGSARFERSADYGKALTGVE